MVAFDALDRRILAELDSDSRQSYVRIARKVRSSKEVVAYRISRFFENGVISGFVSVVDLGKLGVQNYKICFQFHGMDKETEGRFLKFLKEIKDVIWVAKCEGRWDLMVSFFAHNVHEFASMRRAVFKRYGKFVHEYAIAINEAGFKLPRGIFGEERKRLNELYAYSSGVGAVELSRKEELFLLLLAKDARVPLLSCSRKTGLSTKTLAGRLKQFRRIRLVQGFTVSLNHKSAGIAYYKLFISLSDISPETVSRVFAYCSWHPSVLHLIKTIGQWELELECESWSIETMHELARSLRNKFSAEIKRIESVLISDELKLSYFPERL